MSGFPFYMYSEEVVEMVQRRRLLAACAPWQLEQIRAEGKAFKDCWTEEGVKKGCYMVSGLGTEVAPVEEVERLVKADEEEKAKNRKNIFWGNRLNFNGPSSFKWRDIADCNLQMDRAQSRNVDVGFNELECYGDFDFPDFDFPVPSSAGSVPMQRVHSDESDSTQPPQTPELSSAPEASSSSNAAGSSKKRALEVDEVETAAEATSGSPSKKVKTD